MDSLTRERVFFKLKHGLDLAPASRLSDDSWFWSPITEDAVLWISEFYSVDKERAWRAYQHFKTGKQVSAPLFQDFSDQAVFGFIFLEDINKEIAWTSPRFAPQRRSSIEWLLHRVFREKPSEELVEQTVRMIECSRIWELASVKYIADLGKRFPENWESTIRPRYLEASKNYEFVFCFLLGTLIYDAGFFSASFGPMLAKRLARLKDTYRKYSISMKKYVRQAVSREATDLVNLGVEYGLIESPDEYFEDQDYEWPLQYKDFPYMTGMPCVVYDFVRGYRQGHSIAFRSDFMTTKSPQTVYLASYWEREMSLFKRRARYATGKILGDLVKMLTGSAGLFLEEAEALVRGNKDYYRDVRGDYVAMHGDTQAFFAALLELGLKPFKLSRQESHEVYGRCEVNTGFGLLGSQYVIRYMSRDMCWTQKKRVRKQLVRNLSARRVLNVLWDVHLKKKVTSKSIKEVLQMLARQRVESARDILRLVSE